jgi:hypothetical protein
VRENLQTFPRNFKYGAKYDDSKISEFFLSLSHGLYKKSNDAEGSGSDKIRLTISKKACSSSYLYSMGLPEKSAGAAGSGSDELCMTT